MRTSLHTNGGTVLRLGCLLLSSILGAQSLPLSPPPSGPANDVKSVPYHLQLDGEDRVLFTGYIQVRFTDQHATTTPPYQVKRLRLIADTLITDKIDFYVQVDATVTPNPLLDAYLQFKLRRQARIRIGQFKLPFSGESLTSDERTIPIERSIVVNAIAPGRDNGSQGRDLGIALLGNAGVFEYGISVVNGSGVHEFQSGRDRAAAGRIVAHPWQGVSLGGDYYRGRVLATGGSFTVVKQRQDLEAGYKKGRFISWAEYLWGRDGATRRNGGYAMASYRPTGRWETFVRAERYNAQQGKPRSIRRLYEAGANFYIVQLVRLQANYGIQKLAAGGALSPVFLAQVQAEF